MHVPPSRITRDVIRKAVSAGSLCEFIVLYGYSEPNKTLKYSCSSRAFFCMLFVKARQIQASYLLKAPLCEWYYSSRNCVVISIHVLLYTVYLRYTVLYVNLSLPRSAIQGTSSNVLFFEHMCCINRYVSIRLLVYVGRAFRDLALHSL